MQTEANDETPGSDIFVPYSQLAEHGISYSRVWLNKMMRRREFPAAIQLSQNRIAWRLSELEGWKKSRPRAREDVAA